MCTYCQKDISADGDGGFLAPIGEKGQFKDFCAQPCLKKYEAMEGKPAAEGSEEKEKAPCAVCQQVRRGLSFHLPAAASMELAQVAGLPRLPSHTRKSP